MLLCLFLYYPSLSLWPLWTGLRLLVSASLILRDLQEEDYKGRIVLQEELSDWMKSQILHFYFRTVAVNTSFFRCSPRGFSATCLQQMQGSVVEGLSQTATSGSQCFVFFVWDIKLCPQLTVHNTGISLLLSTSVWVLLSPPIERRETRPTA